jgi:hypothetical protein
MCSRKLGSRRKIGLREKRKIGLRMEKRINDVEIKGRKRRK